MTQPQVGGIPEWTQSDRLRKARMLTGHSTKAFAEKIGVSQKTVNNAESGNHAVRKIVMNAWALATGVPVEWLETGKAPTSDSPPTPGPGSELPRLDSNQQPSDITYLQVSELAVAS